jgi:hypothetical protein
MMRHNFPHGLLQQAGVYLLLGLEEVAEVPVMRLHHIRCKETMLGR